MTTALSARSVWDPSGDVPFAERWGGFLIALAFHLMLISILFRLGIPQTTSASSQSVVHLSIAPAQPPTPPLPPPTPTPEPVVSEVGRTSDRGEEMDNEARESSPLEQVVTVPPAEQVQGEDRGSAAAPEDSPDFAESPERERPALLSEAVRRRMAQQWEVASADIAEQIVEENTLEGRLWIAQDEMRTRNANYISDGRPGRYVREIDLTDVPLAIARQTLERYGARFETRYLTPEEVENQGPISLNAVRMSDSEVLTARRGGQAGEYFTISYGEELTARLLDLEINELAHRGIRLNRVSLERVVFSIHMALSGWDLYVKDIEFIEVER